MSLPPEPAILNTAMEDFLAHGASEEEHTWMLTAWLWLGLEYLTRLRGLDYTLKAVENLAPILKTNPWKS